MDKSISWQQKLITSLSKTEQESSARFFQLATVDEFGIPHNRTVVMRNFDADAGSIDFSSDNRSEKCHHLRFNSSAAICWYFAETREQYRMYCRAELNNTSIGRAEVTEQWGRLSTVTRASFFKPPPGNPAPNQLTSTNPDLQFPPDNFVVVRLYAEKVDYLNVDQNPHSRWEYVIDSNDDWQARRINP